ncbi:MAG: CBS domain-containing protein [Desulfovibrionales bacterium]
MTTASDIMTTDPITVTPDMEITSAAKILLEKRINGVPVVDKTGNLVGILCQSDLIAAQKKVPVPSLFTILDGFIPLSSIHDFEREMEKLSAVNVSQAMTPEPVTVTPETPLEEVATIMVKRKFHTLPVVTGKKLVGIVGKEDILRTLLGSNT